MKRGNSRQRKDRRVRAVLYRVRGARRARERRRSCSEHLKARCGGHASLAHRGARRAKRELERLVALGVATNSRPNAPSEKQSVTLCENGAASGAASRDTCGRLRCQACSASNRGSASSCSGQGGDQAAPAGRSSRAQRVATRGYCCGYWGATGDMGHAASCVEQRADECWRRRCRVVGLASTTTCWQRKPWMVLG